ncbi:MAG TPA: L,D-transpeptidase family protein [Terriglobia bacterium]|nr:L,D-transpeptidase family protein [Terriglobia bacterium]
MCNLRSVYLPTILVLLSAGCGRSHNPASQPASSTSGIIDVENVPDFVSSDAQSQGLWDSTKQVYALRQFQPVAPSADAALQTLENAASEGLHPEDFGVTELRMKRDALQASADSEQRNDFDRRLTYALVRYVSQLCFGRVNPRDVNTEWPAGEKQCDVSRIVHDALQMNTVENLSDQLSPKIPEYSGLKAQLKRYRDIVDGGVWQSLEPGAVKAATADARSVLAANLVATGDLQQPNTGESPSAKAVIEALRSFQERHGIEPDGRLGKQTIAAMNVPVPQRIEQIEINMDRMRWIGDSLEPRHLRVNIPGFQLSVHDAGRVPLQMRAIVGSKEDPTPVLKSAIAYLVFSPYWNIPLSIATEELLPKIRKNPQYLRRENIEVVRGSGEKAQVIDPGKIDWEKSSDNPDYYLRQKPGAKNALGLVKFIFPNPYNVYLHDTPSDNLFGRLTRTLSHGCVRVEKPADLAAYLLQDQPEWTPERIEEAMHAEKETKVSLKTQLPVHLLYWTAWTDAEGHIHFRDDVYGYDEKQRQLTGAGRGALPAAHAPDIDVNEIGTGIVPNSTGLHGKSGLPQQ